MAIIQTVNYSMFCDAFTRANREGNFTYEAKRILFDHLEEMSHDCVNDVLELDVIAICCEYAELHYTDVISEYSNMLDVSGIDEEDKQALIDSVEEFLQDNTMVCGKTDDNCFVFAQF